MEEISTFVQFFAAVYFAMSFENTFEKHFWSPNYYSSMMNSIDRIFKLKKDSSFKNKINNSLKDKEKDIKFISHNIAKALLFLCILLLFYIGIESDISEEIEIFIKLYAFSMFVISLCTIFYRTVFSKFLNIIIGIIVLILKSATYRV